jgi:pilus assembly protein Flp/PilA
MRSFKLFWKNKNGATAVEYGLLVSILAVTLAAALGNYYNLMDNMFGGLGNTFKHSTE